MRGLTTKNHMAVSNERILIIQRVIRRFGRRFTGYGCVRHGTDLIADLPEDQMKQYKALVPIKRFGTIEEVARAVLFLADRDSAYINGAVLEISGGL